jgi:hypothetical protein
MAAYSTARHIRLFDYPQWAAPLREEIRARAEEVAREAGLTIDFIRVINPDVAPLTNVRIVSAIQHECCPEFSPRQRPREPWDRRPPRRAPCDAGDRPQVTRSPRDGHPRGALARRHGPKAPHRRQQ